MEKIIDARGFTCPKPVIMAKKAMDECKKGDVLQVAVDNEIAVENLRKLASSQEGEFSFEKTAEKHYEVKIVVTKEANAKKEEEKEAAEIQVCDVRSGRKTTVVVLSSDKMGDGEPELGHILIKGFLYALTQLEELPDTVLLYNKGVWLSCEGSEVLEDLKALEQGGTEIFTCGTCLNYYGLGEKLAVGSVANMYHIVETQAKADRIIRP